MPDSFILAPGLDGEGPVLPLAEAQPAPTTPVDPQSGPAQQVAAALREAASGEPTDGAPYQDVD